MCHGADEPPGKRLGQSPVRRHPLTANSRLSCPDRGVRLPDGDKLHDDAAVLVISFGRYPLACRQSRTSLYRLPRKRWHYPRGRRCTAFQENAGTTPAPSGTIPARLPRKRWHHPRAPCLPRKPWHRAHAPTPSKKTLAPRPRAHAPDVPDELATNALVEPLGHVVLDEFLDQVPQMPLAGPLHLLELYSRYAAQPGSISAFGSYLTRGGW